MNEIPKHIVTDENGVPIAVQIAYADWVRLEARLSDGAVPVAKENDLRKHEGLLSLRVDPMEFQQRVRSEWP